MTLPAPRAAAAVAVAGCVALVLRPLMAPPVLALVALFALLLAVGAAWPASADSSRPMVGAAVLAVGLGAFVVGRMVGGGRAVPHALVVHLVVLNSLAAVAEEAFFRRFIYGLLARTSVAMAVVGSSVLFAIVHVTVYGLWVLPIDLTAGLVLSWQRWASGSWRVPAVTHVVANLLVVI